MSSDFVPAAQREDALRAYHREVGQLLERDCKLHDKSFECHQLAEFTQGVLKDLPAAQAWYERLCAREYGPSCFNLAAIHMSGRSEGTSQASALALFDKACDLGHAEACNNAGLLWQRGVPAYAADVGKAAARLQTGCEGGVRNSCLNLSILHLRGAPGHAPDKPRALLYAVKACALGHSWGCANASRMLQTGDGVPADPVKAAEFRDLALELDRLSRENAAATAPPLR